MSDFVRAVGIDAALAEAFATEKAPWATDPLPEPMRHLLDGCLLGVERLWRLAELEQEPLLCARRDRARLPDYTLLDRALTRFEAPGMPGRLRAVGEKLVRRALIVQPWSTLDCDSTVETVHGEQEGARPGPNPHKRGRVSSHPLPCRERRSGLVVHSRLRPGDTGTATDAVAFLNQSVARQPHARRRAVRVRADRGFDAEALSAACQRRGWHDLVKLRVTADLASRIRAHATGGRWRRLDPHEPAAGEVSEFRFARQCWRRARRVIVTRRRDAENPQGHLRDAAGDNHAADVTDLPGAPADLVACYGKRADMEKTIHELEVLAFNPLVLVQRQALGRATTVRRRLLAVAGHLIRTAGRWMLTLATDWIARPDLVRVRAHLATLGP